MSRAKREASVGAKKVKAREVLSERMSICRSEVTIALQKRWYPLPLTLLSMESNSLFGMLLTLTAFITIATTMHLTHTAPNLHIFKITFLLFAPFFFQNITSIPSSSYFLPFIANFPTLLLALFFLHPLGF